MFQITSPQSLDLPGSNLSSPAVRADLSAQIRSFEASATALFQQCLERTGHDALSHVGTQSVVRDLDFLGEPRQTSAFRSQTFFAKEANLR